MKKFFSLLLVFVMLASFACVNAESTDGPVTIELFYSPWGSTPYDGVDPYEQYLEEKYGCDFVLSPATDFETQLYSRAVGDDMPDLILFGNMSQLMTAYNQGLVLEDWSEYLKDMPQTSANMSDLCKSYLTNEGRIIACPSFAGTQKWTFMIRQDWLDALGLAMPTNDEEFLNVMRAFTFNDPDGNGIDDTYGFTSAGGNTGIGELSNLMLLYTAPSFYITEDGEVSHNILDGGFMKFLNLAKTMVDEKIIDPDWYTQGWDDRKPNLYAGKFGVCWYPPVALTNENVSVLDEETVLNMWSVMPLYTGALIPETFCGALRTVSKAAAEDPAKMEIITSYLEDCAYPNEDFFVIREGYKIDGYDVFVEMADNVYFLGMSSPDNPRARDYGSIMYGWGQMIQSAATEVSYFFGNTAEPSKLNLAQAQMIAEYDTYATYGAEYYLLNPDATLKADSDAMISEFEIDYILGSKTEADFEAFQQEWLELYGNELMADAVATYQAYGLIG